MRGGVTRREIESYTYRELDRFIEAIGELPSMGPEEIA